MMLKSNFDNFFSKQILKADPENSQKEHTCSNIIDDIVEKARF